MQGALKPLAICLALHIPPRLGISRFFGRRCRFADRRVGLHANRQNPVGLFCASEQVSMLTFCCRWVWIFRGSHQRVLQSQMQKECRQLPKHWDHESDRGNDMSVRQPSCQPVRSAVSQVVDLQRNLSTRGHSGPSFVPDTRDSVVGAGEWCANAQFSTTLASKKNRDG